MDEELKKLVDEVKALGIEVVAEVNDPDVLRTMREVDAAMEAEVVKNPDAENPLDKLGLPKSPLLGETDPRFLKPYRLPGESQEHYRARREAANNYVKYTQRYGSGK